MKLRINESDVENKEYYVNEYLPTLNKEKLISEFEHALLQNVGQRGKYDTMISEIRNEILSRMS
jgi:hypothetical protein